MAIIRVGVLRGGSSREYEVSLSTGKHILDMLNAEPLNAVYKGIDVFIDKKGVWHIDGIPHTPEQALKKVDVVFNATRGHLGENGKLQKIFDAFSMPYIGTPAYGSSLTQNKALAKEHFKKHGIKTPYYKELNLEPAQDLEPVAMNLFRTFPMPLIVKPKGLGSSLGVSFASNIKELIEALDHARGFSNEVIVEEYMTGKEIISGFIDDFRGRDMYHLFPVEIKPHATDLFGQEVTSSYSGPISQPNEDKETEKVSVADLSPEEQALMAKLSEVHAQEAEGSEVQTVVNAANINENVPASLASPVAKRRHAIFDWIAKRIGAYDHQSPARLQEKDKKAIEEVMKSAREIFGLRHFATADFIVHPRRGVYLLEINTEPGLHEHSPVYKSLDALGIKHHEFLDHLIQLALKRQK